MKQELKKCPFCGGKAEVDAIEVLRGAYMRAVTCTVCTAQSGWFDTEKEAVKKWNRRDKE